MPGFGFVQGDQPTDQGGKPLLVEKVEGSPPRFVLNRWTVQPLNEHDDDGSPLFRDLLTTKQFRGNILA